MWDNDDDIIHRRNSDQWVRFQAVTSMRNKGATVHQFQGYSEVQQPENTNKLLRTSVTKQRQYYNIHGYSKVLPRVIVNTK